MVSMPMTMVITIMTPERIHLSKVNDLQNPVCLYSINLFLDGYILKLNLSAGGGGSGDSDNGNCDDDNE